MNNKYEKFLNKSKIIILSLILPLLIFTPFQKNNEVKAALEFQWDQNTGYRRLKWYQKDGSKRARNTIFFFLRPSDRKGSLLKITLKIPKTFKSNLKEEKISFCKVNIGGFESRTKCIDDIPADIELNEDGTSLDIFPYKPVLNNKDSLAIVLKMFNPKRTGLYQFHTYGQYSGNNSVSTYLGSATIVID